MNSFVVVRTDYPMEVHRAGCRDIPRHEGDWKISGDNVDDAVRKETAALNSEFDHEYDTSDLFRIMPCARLSPITK
jgi:hypothetical protein